VNQRDLAGVARGIIDANRYMTLATADGEGRPWASPVWFAHEDHREFLWVSRPDARHSRNLEVRPEVAIVVFDSTAPVRQASGVYIEARGQELAGAALDDAIVVFSARSLEHGLSAWAAADVVEPAPHRLYRATASAHFLLGDTDERIQVSAATE